MGVPHMQARIICIIGATLLASTMLPGVGLAYTTSSSKIQQSFTSEPCGNKTGELTAMCPQRPARNDRLISPASAAISVSPNLLTQSQPRVAKPHDFDSDCASGGSNPDRFISCSWEDWAITVKTTVDGVPVELGRLPVSFNSVVEFDENGLTGAGPSWSLTVNVVTGTPIGEINLPIESEVSTGCLRDAGTICTTDSGDEGQPLTLEPDSTSTFEWKQHETGPATQAANEVDTLTGSLGAVLEYFTASGPYTMDDASLNTLWGRCDSVNRFVACVDHVAGVAVSFNGATNKKIKEVAEHVFNAEASLPSHWGNPNFSPGSALHRSLDPNNEAANRAVACVNVPPSCDEYPMASTLEGASHSAVGDWSAVTVPDAANRAQGGTLNTFYQYDRVIENDPFYVLAVKEDGTPSW